jgi:hypothetical protein
MAKGVTKMHQISKAKDDELTTPTNITRSMMLNPLLT